MKRYSPSLAAPALAAILVLVAGTALVRPAKSPFGPADEVVSAVRQLHGHPGRQGRLDRRLDHDHPHRRLRLLRLDLAQGPGGRPQARRDAQALHISQMRTWPPKEGLKWDLIKKDFTGVEIPEPPTPSATCTASSAT